MEDICTYTVVGQQSSCKAVYIVDQQLACKTEVRLFNRKSMFARRPHGGQRLASHLQEGLRLANNSPALLEELWQILLHVTDDAIAKLCVKLKVSSNRGKWSTNFVT